MDDSSVVGVLAEALAQHVCSYHGPPNGTATSYCWCGWSGWDYAAHVASVVAALPNIAIVPTTSVEYAPCWQNEHGVHPLNSTTAWRKGAEDDVERLRATNPDIFLGEHYWTPWAAARAAGVQA